MITYLAIGKSRNKTVICIVVDKDATQAIQALCRRHPIHSEQWELTQVPTVEWVKTITEIPLDTRG